LVYFQVLIKAFLTFTLLFLLSACSGKQIYHTAIDYGRYKADLEVKQIAISDDLNMTYLENKTKSDTTLVLVHGFSASKDHWLRLADEIGDDYHLIIPDLIGHGSSSKPKDISYSLQNQTLLLHQFLQKMSLKKSLLIGNSMGGALSLLYASEYKNIEALILIDSFGIKVQDSYVDKMGVSKVKQTWLHVCTKEKFGALISQGMVNPPYVPDSVLEYLTARKCLASDFEEKRYYDILNQDLQPLDDLSQEAQTIDVQTLILWGKEDKVLSYKNAYAFEKSIKNSRVIILDNLGHVPMVEDAPRVASEIIKFLKTTHIE